VNELALFARGVVMGGRASRSKGQRGEREIVAFLERLGYTAGRGWQSRQGHAQCDVEGTEWWIEVKRGKKVNVRAAMRQAVADRDDRRPLVIWRDDREPWMVSVSLEDAVRLFEGAADGATSAGPEAGGPGEVVDQWGRLLRRGSGAERPVSDVDHLGPERQGGHGGD